VKPLADSGRWTGEHRGNALLLPQLPPALPVLLLLLVTQVLLYGALQHPPCVVLSQLLASLTVAAAPRPTHRGRSHTPALAHPLLPLPLVVVVEPGKLLCCLPRWHCCCRCRCCWSIQEYRTPPRMPHPW
jgi:hypothetical protein